MRVCAAAPFWQAQGFVLYAFPRGIIDAANGVFRSQDMYFSFRCVRAVASSVSAGTQRGVLWCCLARTRRLHGLGCAVCLFRGLLGRFTAA